MNIIVTQEGRPARRIEAGGVPQERFLQDFILANPESLPLTDIREDLQFAVVAHEFPTASGPVDALGLDDEGNLYLIETKLFRNPDKRRVLAQVLDYGAALWRYSQDPKPFRERLEEAARDTLELGLVESLRASFAVEDVDVERLLQEAEQQAEQGSFRFVVLMDRIDDRLRDLIGFINEKSLFDVYGVELQFFRFDGYELVIPKLHGAEARKSVSGGSTGGRRQWDEKEYFADAVERLGIDAVAALRRLYAFAVGHADRVTWGSGKTVGSFSLKYSSIHPTKSVVSVYSDGRLDLNFPWHTGETTPLPEEIRALARSLDRNLEGWHLPADHTANFVGIPLAIWGPQVESVLGALGHLKPA